MNATRRARIEFFADHAGYATPPGRMLCAKSLADAEERREALEAEGRAKILWEADIEADLSWADAETLRRLESGTYEMLACLVSLDGYTASLCGIVVDTATPFRRDPYCRVVEAELAAELLDDLVATGKLG